METDDIVWERQGSRAILRMNRPAALNALTASLRQGLVEGLRRAADDPEVRVVILRGEGRAFSVGQDLKEMQSYYQEHGPQLGQLVEDEYIPIVHALRGLPKPTIAVVEGAAVGGGMALALATDFRVITNRAQLVPGFVNVALAPDTGTTFLLARAIGYHRALNLCLLGEPLRANDMVSWGLAKIAHESSESLEDELNTLADKLAHGPTRAYAEIRRMFDRAQPLGLQDVLMLERDVQDALAHTQDHREAVDAFLAKRPPNFTGA
ncbi:enoyl-CoA hydratase-related protein [Sulfobacillus harzensis]|uniref:Enoyl-CoA hydratase/isomerase family protein n=1 Tax=Sulfobacillus harzensis TaxID=2729629 RepID=A0A7Y0L0K1_9FIRM|nr:enoyl-CoA hydratase/isomerase family protein [Sulfobacillus harzensis]